MIGAQAVGLPVARPGGGAYARLRMPRLEHSRRAGDGRGPEGEPSPDERARWGRVKALFLEALEYPPSERSAFVVRASAGDADLGNEVESLLASEEAAASLGETP